MPQLCEFERGVGVLDVLLGRCTSEPVTFDLELADFEDVLAFCLEEGLIFDVGVEDVFGAFDFGHYLLRL
jgi:hypothetical protein